MRSTTDFEGWSRATSISKTEVVPSFFVPRDTMHSPSSRNFWNKYDDRSVMAVAFGGHKKARRHGRSRTLRRPHGSIHPTSSPPLNKLAGEHGTAPRPADAPSPPWVAPEERGAIAQGEQQ